MHTSSVTIVKLGGKLIDQPDRLSQSLQSFASITGYKILVHGGGVFATRVAEQMGISAPMVKGRRITDHAMMDVAVMVYSGKVNTTIVGLLQSMGVNALGVTGADLNLISAHQRPKGDIDYGLAGDIDNVNVGMLSKLLNLGISPVFAPITHNNQGQLLNTNADTIASTVSRYLADRFDVNLIYCFDKIGVLEDPLKAESLIPEIDLSMYRELISKGVIKEGMIPKLDNAFEALTQGVKNVYICSSDEIHNISTTKFTGTHIYI